MATESDKNETGAREQAVQQRKTERDRLQARVETMYLDRLDGRISAEFLDEKSKVWRDQQKDVEARINQLATTGLRSATEAVQTMGTVSAACAVFNDAQPEQKRVLTASLMQNPTLKAGKFESSWKSPFDVLALSNSASRTNEREKAGSGREIEIWLPVVDAFRTLPLKDCNFEP
jgi:site-specific DNA recombinase